MTDFERLAIEALGLVCIAFIARAFVASKKSQKFRLRRLSLTLVSALLLGCVVSYLFSLTLTVATEKPPIIVHYLLFVVFNFTIYVISRLCINSKFIKYFIFSVMLTASIFGWYNDMNFHETFQKIDVIAACGTYTSEGNGILAGCEVPRTEAGNPVGLTMFFISVYYFICFSIIFYYFGITIKINHEYSVAGRYSRGLDPGTIDKAIVIISVALAAIIGFILAGGDLPSVTIFTGLVVAGVSISLRDLLNNFMAGLILIWDRSVKKGDVVTLPNGKRGVINNITMRYISLKDRDEVITLIPNAYFTSGPIENLTQNDAFVRLKVQVTVPYDVDGDQIEDVLRTAAHKTPRVHADKQTRIFIRDFTERGVLYEILFWVNDTDKGIGNVKAGVRHSVLSELKKSKIKVPFPNQNVFVEAVALELPG